MLLSVTAAAHAEENLDVPPFAGDVKTVPLGAWARYRTAYFGGNSRQDVQIALIAKGARQATWQMSFIVIDDKRGVLQLITAPGPDGAPVLKGKIVQVGSDPAYRVPLPEGAPRPALRVPAPRERDGSETITVTAGSFPCERYHQETEPGHGYDFWVSRKVAPTGIVKFEEWTKGGNGVRLVQRTWELLETGRGARSLIRGKILPNPPPPPPKRRHD